jgi:type II secretory pathway component GspD/PulD (secretin)
MLFVAILFSTADFAETADEARKAERGESRAESQIILASIPGYRRPQQPVDSGQSSVISGQKTEAGTKIEDGGSTIEGGTAATDSTSNSQRSTSNVQGQPESNPGLVTGDSADQLPTTNQQLPAADAAAYTFRFDNAALADILTLYSDLSRRTVIHAPGLPQGPVSVDVKTPLTKAEALLTLETLLYANGVSLTPVGEKLVKAFPNASIVREGLPIQQTDLTLNAERRTSNVEDGMEGDRITATIIPLKHIDVSDPSIIPTLSHFIHQPGGSIIPLHRSNSLLVVETTLNLKRLLQILENLDQPTEDRVEVKYYELRNIEASKMAGMLQGMMAGIEQRERRTLNVERPTSNQPARRTATGRGAEAAPTLIPTANREPITDNQSRIAGRVSMHADDRTNTLIIFT